MHFMNPFGFSNPSGFCIPSKNQLQEVLAPQINENQSTLFGGLGQLERKVDQGHSQMLVNLMLSMNSNSLHLQQLSQKLQESQVHMDTLVHELREQPPKRKSCQDPLKKEESFEEDGDQESNRYRTTNPLVQQLFGNHSYKYRLVLDGPDIKVLFKERNFNLNVRLVDQKNQKVMNSNMLHLCIGVCDTNGEWVTRNQVGQLILKGRTETDLYHGDTSFQKIYFRDISKRYPAGTLNLVVYVKPSLLQFGAGNSAVQREVRCEDIEPLMLKDLAVLSKRQQYQ